jgi:hypothetical protein
MKFALLEFSSADCGNEVMGFTLANRPGSSILTSSI